MKRKFYQSFDYYKKTGNDPVNQRGFSIQFHDVPYLSKWKRKFIMFVLYIITALPSLKDEKVLRS